MDDGYGFFGVFAAASLIFFAYLGFEDVANIAEETRNPRRNIPNENETSFVELPSLEISNGPSAGIQYPMHNNPVESPKVRAFAVKRNLLFLR